jgi:hypothetical protein
MFLYGSGLEVADDQVLKSSNIAGNQGQPKAGDDIEKPQDWKYVIVIAELECQKRGDLNRNLVLQLADYARLNGGK